MDKEQCTMCGKSPSLVDLFELSTELKDSIEYYCRIEFLDFFPKKICALCSNTVENFAKFTEDAKLLQLKFAAFFKQANIELEQLPEFYEGNKSSSIYIQEPKFEIKEEETSDTEIYKPITRSSAGQSDEINSKIIDESGCESEESTESDSDYEVNNKSPKRKRPIKHRRVKIKKRRKSVRAEADDENDVLEEVPESDRYKNGTLKKKALTLYEGKTWKELKVQCVDCDQVLNGPFELRDHHFKHHSLDSQFKCSECTNDPNDVNFSYFYQFLNHYPENHQKHFKFCCVICSEMFWNTRSLNQHMTSDHNRSERSALFHCKRCGQYFRKSFDLAKHESRVHNIDIIQPEVDVSTKVASLTMEDIFEKEFKEDYSIEKSPFKLQNEHKNPDGSITAECKELYTNAMWNNIAVHQCCHCGIQSNSPYQLYEHYNAEHKELKNNFTCKACPEQKVFLNMESYVNHIFTIHHEHLRYFCFICYDGFWNYKTLYHHYKKEHEDYKALICLYCGKYHKSVYDIRHHKEVHSTKHEQEKKSKNFTCTICSKTFSRQNLLLRHLNIHVKNENKLWICETCGKSFNAKSSLINHGMVHQTEKPFICSVCGEGFKNKYKLKHHKGIHTGERNFACEICGQRFRAKGTLKGHILTHTGERPFGCEFCDKRFAAKYDLMVHTRLHTGEFTHECQICHERYPSWSNYSKHMRGRHQIDPRSEKKKKYDAIAKIFQEKKNETLSENDQSLQYFPM